MTRCLDIHTHHNVPQPQGVVSVSIESFNPIEGQYYSIGVHPWDVKRMPDRAFWNAFTELAKHPSVVAIGECGIDKLRGGPLFLQMLVMKQQIEISEQLGKPLVIHDVKGHDQIIGIRKEADYKQNWVVHGFRGKPTIAKMYVEAGIYLSFGEKYNPQSLASMPLEMILAETDESPLTIEEIIGQISQTLYSDQEDRYEKGIELISGNTDRFLFNEGLRLEE